VRYQVLNERDYRQINRAQSINDRAEDQEDSSMQFCAAFLSQFDGLPRKRLRGNFF
jgi:hypothetical protein